MIPAAAVKTGSLVQIHPDRAPVSITKVQNATPVVGFITWQTEAHGDVVVGGSQRVTPINRED